jgi:alkylation response protein AidB-like acyl-CoA dehydrogenase
MTRIQQERPLFDEEHQLYRDSVRRLLADEVGRGLAAWREAGKVPLDVLRRFGDNGLLCPQVPEAYGGPGGDFRFNVVVAEEVAYSGLSQATFSVHSDIVAGYVLAYGNESQKASWLPRMVSGEVIGAICMTEPNAGSDLKALRTRAERVGDAWQVNGSKIFITNGQNAGLFVVAAKTDPSAGAKGISLFLVEGDRPGLRRGRNLDKIGMKDQDTSEIFFDDVILPHENLLGKENDGFVAMMRELPQERLSLAVAAVASAERAFELTLDYASERRAFDQRILDFQNTRFTLADVKTELNVARYYIDECVRRHVAGELTAEQGAMAKLWTTELQGRVVDRCLQLFGGYGYMTEYEIAQFYTAARVQRIYGGTSEIMREIIGRGLASS